LAGHGSIINAIAFSDDGTHLITGSDDHTARVWDASTGATTAVLSGHETAVNAVAISADGKLAVTGSGSPLYMQSANDNTVRIWELPGGKPLNILGKHGEPTGHADQAGHEARIRSVAIPADSSVIASGSDDGNVILWDRATGEVLRTIHDSHGPVLALSFDAAGHTLVCASDRLSVWTLNAPAIAHELEPSVAAARQALLSNPHDSAAVLSLGKWYVQADHAPWAANFLQLAREGHQEVSPLDLARCHWERGDLLAAEREMKLSPPQSAPPFYVNLCMEAMRAESHDRK
jgi:hypothetical protein